MKNHRQNNSVIVVGSVALDDIKTPYGEVRNALGGSATYFSIASSLFAKVNIVAVVGEDFPKRYLRLFRKRNINIEGLEQAKGQTFHWKGYYQNFNEAITLDTQLNVFEKFNPQIPKNYIDSKILFLANINPDIQERVLIQKGEAEIVASDTMNHWIKTHKKELKQLYKKVNIAFLNENEAKLFSGEDTLIKAAKMIKKLGPQWVIIKRGEYGVFAYNGKEFIALPAYPLEKVIDTTGAGDSFAGAFMGYLASVRRIDNNAIRKALAYGSVIASYAVQDFGVKSLLRINHIDIEKRLNRFNKMIKIKA